MIKHVSRSYRRKGFLHVESRFDNTAGVLKASVKVKNTIQTNYLINKKLDIVLIFIFYVSWLLFAFFFWYIIFNLLTFEENFEF